MQGHSSQRLTCEFFTCCAWSKQLTPILCSQLGASVKNPRRAGGLLTRGLLWHSDAIKSSGLQAPGCSTLFQTGTLRPCFYNERYSAPPLYMAFPIPQTMPSFLGRQSCFSFIIIESKHLSPTEAWFRDWLMDIWLTEQTKPP